jgi:hypothetical protein
MKQEYRVNIQADIKAQERTGRLTAATICTWMPSRSKRSD